MENPTSQILSHWVLRFGIGLFLLGLISGMVIPAMENPRMGLTSHLEGVINGTFLIALGAIWPRLTLGSRAQKALFVIVLYGSYANWLATFLAGLWGAGSAMMPIAGGDYTGTGAQEALITLLLALTDNFTNELNPSYQKALEAAKRLDDSYCSAYYTGIIYERRAKAHLGQGGPGSGAVAYSWFSKALESYDRALKGCDPDNQDAVLRWNSCARIINEHPDVKPGDTDSGEMFLDSFETPH